MYNPTNPFMQMQPGYATVARPKYTNPLTKEQMQLLRKNGGGFSLVPTQEELAQAVCTHRDSNTGASLLIDSGNGDNTVTCSLCHCDPFELKPYDQETVMMAVNDIVDLFESSKVSYLDAPEQVTAEYMRVIPLLKKFPQFYKIAADNFAQYENTQQMSMQGTNNLYYMYNNMTGAGMYPGYPNYMNGMPVIDSQFTQQAQQPFGYNQQMINPQMDASYMQNPFYGQGVATPQFQNTQQVAQPAPQAQAAPAAPVQQPADVNIANSFNV